MSIDKPSPIAGAPGWSAASEVVEGDFALDPLDATRGKAARVRRFAVVEAPALRLAGFSILALLLLACDLLSSPSFDTVGYLWRVGLLFGYALASWYLLWKLHGRLGVLDLGLVFLHADVLLFLVTLYDNGQQPLLLAAVLLSRVADQTHVSFRRAFYFTNLTSGGFLLFLFYRDQVQGLAVDWRASFSFAIILWLVGAYISLTGRTAERLAGRTQQAVRAARGLLRELEEKAEELTRARAQAEAASAAKSEFVAHVSHELRTPMSGVLGLTGLLLERETDPDKNRILKLIRSSADSLLTLLNDLLDLSKIEAGKLELLNEEMQPGELVEDVLQLQALRAAEKGVELASLVSPRVPYLVEGDAGRLRQIVINLVGNAIKFTDEGAVLVDLDAEPFGEGRVQLRLAVRDSGIGIPRDKQGEVFGAFTQAGPSIPQRYGGTGLGLSITAKLVRMMGGTISVESEVGSGSTFFVTVPVSVVASAPPAAALPLHVVGRRALVVDGHTATRSRLQAVLSSWGIESEGTATGAAALLRLRNRRGDGRFDLVLLEAQQTDVDGLAVAAEIKQLGPFPPAVILLSAAGGQFESARCRRAGIAACLNKPVKRSDLLESIQAALRLRAAQAPPLVELPASGALPVSLRRMDVLLVEDNEINRLVATNLLQRMGHSVTAASRGAEAVELCRDRAWGAILMDIEMPGMNGFEATEQIRRLPAGDAQVIVAMTAHATAEARESCLASGMDDYIAKPVGFAALAAAFTRVAYGPLAAPPVIARQAIRSA